MFACILGSLAATTVTSGAAPKAPTARPSGGVAAVGALFSRAADGELGAHFCTASVLDSPFGDLVITAAHCVTGREADTIVFVPEYAKGAAPLGVWAVTGITVDQRWARTADPNDDVALLEIADTRDGRSVEDETGANCLGIGAPAGHVAEVVGYPDSKSVPVSCRNTVTSFSATQFEFDCDGYTAGTSGSPIVDDASRESGDGTVIGVIGGYQQGGDTASVSYAAKFTSNIRALFNLAVAASG